MKLKQASNQFQRPTVEYLFLNGRIELENIKFPFRLRYWIDGQEMLPYEEINIFFDINRYSMSVHPLHHPFLKVVMLKIPYWFITIPFLDYFKSEIKKFIQLYEENYLKKPIIITEVRWITEDSSPSLAVNKKEDYGLPPTSKEVGIRPTIL